MDLKRQTSPNNPLSRDMVSLSADTGNVYETVMVIAKRANQIGQELKVELNNKLEEFQTLTSDDNPMMEESEQMEVSRKYERMPKPTLIAAKEYEDGALYHNVAGRKR